MKKIKISVLTPTWNRANYLKNIRNSLNRQTIDSFEWIVVDDCSDDNTQNVMSDIINSQNKFLIKYARYNKRVGKCKADNLLLDIATKDYIIWCDSDDYLKDDALEILLSNFENGDKNLFAVIGLCENIEGKIQSTGNLKFTELICKWYELESKYKMRNDMCIMISRKFIEDSRFPEHDLVMNESALWHKYRNHKIKCIPNVLKVMNRSVSNRISATGKMEYCRGKAYSIIYAESLLYDGFGLFKKFKTAINYHRYCIHGEINLDERNKLFYEKNKPKDVIYILSYFISNILALKDNIQKKVVKTHLIFEKGRDAKYYINQNEN